MKKLNVIKNEHLKKIEVICKNHPLKCHMKYKVIDFTPSNKSIMAKKLLSTNFG